MVDHLPLNALRAFEVAARTGSFVSAGLELGVSAAAVSQQVKALESRISKTLFLRQGNRITLTEAGRALYPRLEVVFRDLVSMTRALREDQHPSRLVVSALPSLAEYWLTPALAIYSGREDIELRVEQDPVDFARAGVDMRVTYGAHYYPDHHIDVLFGDHLVAVASPDVAAGIGADPGRLPDSMLIHTDWGPDYVNQPDWARWFAASNHPRSPQPGTGMRTGQTSLSIIAARTGAGVALVPWRLAQWELEKGSLVQIRETSVPLTWDYVLVHPHAYAQRNRLKAFCRHLMQVAQKTDTARL